MEEMKIAGLAMALCIVMLGIYIVVPKDGTVSHLTAIPDNNAAQPVTDSTSQGSADSDTGDADFPIYTEDSYSSGSDDSYSYDDTDNGDFSYSDNSGDNSDDGSADIDTDNTSDGTDTSDTSDISDISQDGAGEDGGSDVNYDDGSDTGSDEVVVDDNSYNDTADSDLDTSDTVEVY